MHSPFVAAERLEIAGIPTLKLTPKGIAGKLPTLIYYHGWTSNKDNQIFRLLAFVTFGMQVFAPDAIHHGERGTIDYSAPGLEQYFWETIIQNVQESSLIVDTIVAKYQADSARMGVMGHSMGGFTAAGVFATNPHLKALVAFNGSCAWLQMEEFLEKDPDPAALKKRLAQYDLLNNKDCLRQRPVLMLNGGSDTTVPVDSQRWFYEQVAPLYLDCPERLQLQEFPGVGHFIEVNMLERAVAWFKEYL